MELYIYYSVQYVYSTISVLYMHVLYQLNYYINVSFEEETARIIIHNILHSQVALKSSVTVSDNQDLIV